MNVIPAPSIGALIVTIGLFSVSLMVVGFVSMTLALAGN